MGSGVSTGNNSIGSVPRVHRGQRRQAAGDDNVIKINVRWLEMHEDFVIEVHQVLLLRHFGHVFRVSTGDTLLRPMEAMEEGVIAAA